MNNLKTYLYILAVLALLGLTYLWYQNGQAVLVEVFIILAYAVLALLGFVFSQTE